MKLATFVEAYLAGRDRGVPGKIPWNDPAFSGRMLREHLSQDHDLASRRYALIDQHVSWIHTGLLNSRPSNVLDLACGPGLYCERLAGLGHSCTGIDFSPASIAYARDRARHSERECRYVEGDLLTTDYGSGFDLAMLLCAELNTFERPDVERIVSKVVDALRPGGALLLEVHTPEHIDGIARRARSWAVRREGPFGDRPHLVLSDAKFDERTSAAVQSFFVVPIDSLDVEEFRSTTFRVSRDEMARRLASAGLGSPIEIAGLAPGSPDPSMYVLLARKPHQGAERSPEPAPRPA